ncbi:hypothetical protein QTP70_023795 [Hemibagrus guttatus]|uniref:Alanine--tRNA ligase n=1 Tax=Hemibagrus guttatus TaxID=175788 RepID=A0AAE0PXS4_9TELE|nr:hypothetical protein QTP70_023795 [Hemibagrus guttatus]
MDVYDPQTLGIMVFGGFMVVSAIGIALVSTLSMKETSYEEALAKQRRELAKTQPQRVDKKKKAAEKKSKAKKKEEKPNGKLPEQEAQHDSGHEPASETSEPEPESEPEVSAAPAPVPVAPVVPVIPEPKVEVAVTKPAVAAAPPAHSPKDKKKRKVAKVEPAPAKPVEIIPETITKEPAPKNAKDSTPKDSAAKIAKEPVAKVVKEPAAKATKGAKEATSKAAKEPVAKEASPKVAKEASPKVAKEPVVKEASTKSAKEVSPKVAKVPIAKEAVPKAAKETVAKEAAPKTAKEPSAKVAKETITKEQATKGAKEPSAKGTQEPAAKQQGGKATKEPAAKELATKSAKDPASKEQAAKAVVKESAAKSTKELNVKTGKEPTPKGVKQPAVAVVAEVGPVTIVAPKAEPPKAEPPKPEASSKKKSKKKAESAAAADVADVPLLLPFKTLVSTLSSSSFSDSETQKLLEIISDKAGADTWQLASQKGDPLAALKKQLEEKDKLLSAEQENATASKTRIRELTKELNTEKSKTASVETRLSSELSARQQEITALNARMKASYDEHTLQTQKLNSKIQSLQDQLENGPAAQLARLQQENTILRDALNKASSLAESTQNTELVKLRQDVVRLSRELSERTDAQHADEERRKALESKMAATEEQLAQLKAGRAEAEQALQQALEKVKGELCQAQNNSSTLQAQLQQAQQDGNQLSELRERVRTTEVELKDRCAEVQGLKTQLAQLQQDAEEQVLVEVQAPLQATAPQVENSEELEQLKHSIKEKEDLVISLQGQLEKMKTSAVETESLVQQLQGRLAQRESKVSAAEEELKQLREQMEQQKSTTESSVQQLQLSLTERERQVSALEEEMKQLREQIKQQNEAAEAAEAEQPFENLEKDARLITLEEELQQLRGQVEQAKAESKELQEKNRAAAESLAAAKRLSEERLNQVTSAQNEVKQKLDALQAETKTALQTLFPHIAIETEQSNWLEAFTLRAQETLAHRQQDASEEKDSAPTDALQKLKQAEERQTALQAQCEQYRATLSETEGILKDLQNSVQDGEAAWKSKLSEVEEQRQALKGQVMLLEAQLEKQLESISFSQSCADEVEQLKTLLTSAQSQLEAAQSDTQKQRAELSVVRQQLQAVTEHVQSKEDTQTGQVQAQLQQANVRLQTEASARQEVEQNYGQAQKCVGDLEALVAEMKAAGEGATTDLKERLEKEVKLTQELTETSATLQQKLNNTQEELTKEKEVVKSLQEQLQEKVQQQFKPLLLGCADPRSEMASYRRVVNSQKCVRAGGKHNDLEDVGRDVYHHTFFEMLGNWSFGDYFKVEACTMAWRLLTEVYRIPAERLYVSYFSGDEASGLPEDKETQQIWRSLGVHPDRILPFGMKDNFWEMGETGPCGPCTEIHYDHVGDRNAGALVNADSPDVVEIWNLVFMQEGDGSLRPLPQCSVDTGMGLERLVTVLQGKRSNYDTDLFTPLLSAIHECSKVGAYSGRTGEVDRNRVDMAYRVVADHIRTLCVCIADGVYPGMNGAELVLRRILRRAVRFSTEVLQAPEGALASLVPTVAHILGDAYPELHRETDRIVEIININEAQFLSSLKQGRRVIERTLNKMDGDTVEFPAAVAWSLHRNLGFPLDLIDLMLEERGMSVDKPGVERLAAEHDELQSRSEGDAVERGLHSDLQSLSELQSRGIPHTDDAPKYSYALQQDGYYAFLPCRASVLVLYSDQGLVSEVTEGQRCSVLLDRTCFYAEQGGQTHDTGYFTKDGATVECVRVAGGYVVHEVTAADTLRIGDQLELHVDEAQRLACMVKHTATHMLNFVLRELLGSDVVQRGSHVTADRLRFDFSSKASLSVSQLQEVEHTIQNIIQQNDEVHTQEVPLARANQIAGLRTVDEILTDTCTLIRFVLCPWGSPFPKLLSSDSHKRASVELCCGTHLLRTGGIQDLVIVSERQMVKGISRIIAVTGDDAKNAREAGQALLEEVDSLAARITAGPAQSLPTAIRLSKEVGLLTDAVESTRIPQWQRREIQTRLKALQRSTNTTIRKLELKEAAAKAQVLLSRHSDKAVLVDTLDTDSISVVMKTVNQLSERTPHTLVMLLSHHQPSGKVLCACQVPKGQTAISASEWALAVCSRLGGNAGGSATVAKGVGIATDSSSLQDTLRWAEEFANGKC